MATYRNSDEALMERVRRYIKGLGYYAKPPGGIPASDLAGWVLPSAVTDKAVGHYTYNTDFTAISEITNSGVAQHPSNKGMCAIANEILNAIGYDKSTNTYSLQSVTVGGVTGTMWVLDE